MKREEIDNDFKQWSNKWNKKSKKTVVFEPLDNALEVKVIPTGIPTFDQILGPTGRKEQGFPRGRTTLLFGEPSSGKTLLSQISIASAQKRGGRAMFFDIEKTYDPRWFELTGVKTDPEKLIIVRPDNMEQTFDMIVDALENLKPDVIVVDSIPAMMPKAVMLADMEKQDFQGVTARKITEGIKKCTQANDTTVLIFINQLRVSLGVRFGNPESLPGGKALKFLCSVMIRCRRGKWLTDSADGGSPSLDFDEIPDDKEAKRIGFLLRLRVEKNKIAPPFEECDLKFYFNGAIDWINSLVHQAIVQNIIVEEKQAYFKVPEVEKLIHGRPALEELIRNDENLKTLIINKLKEGVI